MQVFYFKNTAGVYIKEFRAQTLHSLTTVQFSFWKLIFPIHFNPFFVFILPPNEISDFFTHMSLFRYFSKPLQYRQHFDTIMTYDYIVRRDQVLEMKNDKEIGVMIQNMNCQ